MVVIELVSVLTNLLAANGHGICVV